jgi:hypothetical protein
MFVLKWSDRKKKMSMNSTYHGDYMREVKTKRELEREKSVTFLDYDQNMIGVDQIDQLLHAYLLKEKR